MSGNVRDDDAEVSVVEEQKVIEVARYSAHGEIAGSNFELKKTGNFAWKNRSLDLLSDFELFFDRAKALFLDGDAVSNQVAEAIDESKKADRFEVPSWNDAQANEIRVEHEEAEDA